MCNLKDVEKYYEGKKMEIKNNPIKKGKRDDGRGMSDNCGEEKKTVAGEKRSDRVVSF